jgi:hypothetical protein
MDETLPMICEVTMEFKILLSRTIREGVSYPNILNVVIGHDGSVFIKSEQKYQRQYEVKTNTFHNWQAFKAYYTPNNHPAQLIEEWIKKNNVTFPFLKPAYTQCNSQKNRFAELIE